MCHLVQPQGGMKTSICGYGVNEFFFPQQMQNTKQSHRSMLSGGEFRITMKLKQSMASMPRLDFLTFQPRQGEKYAIENGLLSNRMFAREKTLTNTFILFLVLDMVLLFLYFQADHLPIVGPLWLPCSFALHLLNTSIYFLLLYLRYEENTVLRRQNGSLLFSLATLSIFLVVHPSPCWDGFPITLSYDDYDYINKEYTVPLNHLIILPTMIKQLYLTFTRQLVYTRFLSPRGKRLKMLFSVELTQEMYAIKCIFKESPIRMFSAVYAAGYFLFSFAFHITESSIPVQGNPFTYFSNCLWYVLVTATTVGYGDMRILSHLGYIIAIVSMIWGTMIMSCILVILTNTLTLNTKEEEALSAQRRIQMDIEYQVLCRVYVRECVWRLWKNYKHKQGKRQPLAEKRMRQGLYQLREKKKLCNPSTNFAELSQREFDTCLSSASLLSSNNTDLINFIGTHIFSEVLIKQRENPAASQSFIDRGEEKKLQDNIIEEGVESQSSQSSRGQRSSRSLASSASGLDSQASSQKSILQSVSSQSLDDECIPASRLSAVRPQEARCIQVQELRPQSSGKSVELFKSDGI